MPNYVAKPSADSIFEGPQHRLWPAFKASSLSSGMLATVGTMIGHSILLDGQGFPFLAEYYYHYLTGNETLAITSITSEDVSLGVKHILEEVCKQIHDLHPHTAIFIYVDRKY